MTTTAIALIFTLVYTGTALAAVYMREAKHSRRLDLLDAQIGELRTNVDDAHWRAEKLEQRTHKLEHTTKLHGAYLPSFPRHPSFQAKLHRKDTK
ncbi:hypothetical protein [Arcanobacterium canis]